MSHFVVLLGPPGAGKGTQAQLISKKLGIPHISSGDIFRENLKNKTHLGELARGYIERGELVPDDVTIAMIKDRLMQEDCAPGALLDGFPRTPAQAQALEAMLAEMQSSISVVPYIRVPQEVLTQRLSGRWTCRAQGHVYHQINNPPKTPGVCDLDGSDLYQRVDDEYETVVNRIRVYFEQTMPLIDYFRKKGLLVEINGDQPIEDVSRELMRAIAQKVEG